MFGRHTNLEGITGSSPSSITFLQHAGVSAVAPRYPAVGYSGWGPDERN
jgi:hypothetical protein